MGFVETQLFVLYWDETGQTINPVRTRTQRAYIWTVRKHFKEGFNKAFNDFLEKLGHHHPLKDLAIVVSDTYKASQRIATSEDWWQSSVEASTLQSEKQPVVGDVISKLLHKLEMLRPLESRLRCDDTDTKPIYFYESKA